MKHIFLIVSILLLGSFPSRADWVQDLALRSQVQFDGAQDQNSGAHNNPVKVSEKVQIPSDKILPLPGQVLALPVPEKSNLVQADPCKKSSDDPCKKSSDTWKTIFAILLFLLVAALIIWLGSHGSGDHRRSRATNDGPRGHEHGHGHGQGNQTGHQQGHQGRGPKD